MQTVCNKGKERLYLMNTTPHPSTKERKKKKTEETQKKLFYFFSKRG